MARPRKPSRKGWPANLGQNPDGYYYYTNPNTNKKIGLGRDKADSFRQARQANAVLATMTKSTLVDRIMGVKGMSFKDWLPIAFDLWVERVKPSAITQKNMSIIHARLDKADFAWRPLDEINVLQISSYLDEIEENNGAGMATVLRSRLKVLFAYAEAKGHIGLGKNPVTATHTPDYEPTRDRLTMENYLLIRSQARKEKSWLADAMDLALVTAQRESDISDFEFTDEREGFLFVAQNKSQGTTKLKIDTSIWMEAINMTVAEAIKQCRNRFVSPYMIHHTRNSTNAKIGGKVSAKGISEAFSEMRDLVGIKPSQGKTPTTFHEIRSLAERLYREQYGAGFAQLLLGHKNAATTAKYDDLRGTAWTEVKVK